MQEQVDFVTSIEDKTHSHQVHRAGKMTRAFEKKTKTVVFQPGQKVLVDLGKRNRCKNTREAYEATVVTGLEGGQYKVTIEEGDLAGGQFMVGHERIEPLHLADPTIHSTNDDKALKTPSRTSNNHASIGARGRFHGLRKIGATKSLRSAQPGWQPERKAGVNRIVSSVDNKLLNHISTNNRHKEVLPSELTHRSGSHIWKLACSGQLLSNPAEGHLTRRRTRRNNTNQ